MNPYQSNIDLVQAADLLREAGRTIVTTHAKPDGDAFGSVVALTAGLRTLSRDVTAHLVGPILPGVANLPGMNLVNVSGQPVLGDADLLVVLDTGAQAQLGSIQSQLVARADRILIIDHHVTGDLPARWRYIDAQAAACCEIIAQLLDRMDISLEDSIIRDVLFAGIASDTGWFRFSNTRPLTHDLAARLQRAGVDHSALYRALQQSERVEKLALTIRALDSLTLTADNSVAVMVLRARDFLETGTTISDTEFLVDLPQMVGAVQVVVLISQPPEENDHPQPPIRVSFRSKPGPQAVNVAQLASHFGGGGHERAAGAKVHAPLDQVLANLHAALASGMHKL